VRGFYDDNYLTLPSGQGDKGSWGFEIAPSVAVNFPRDQTYFGAAYNYSTRYFEARSDDKWDQTHEFTLNLDHKFSEVHDIEFYNSFVYSQEPEIIDGNNSAPTTRRTDSDAFRNAAELNYNRTLTERLALALGYGNTWYDYKQDGPGSRSALLDRVEQTFRVDGRYMVRENVVGIVGFELGLSDYTADEATDILNPASAKSDIRDNISYALYVGADTQLSQRLTGSFRIGGQYTDYDNTSQDSTSPFLDNFLTYKYRPDSFLRFGVRHFRNATDEAGYRDQNGNLVDNNITLDQDSTAVYAEVSHKFTARINGRLTGQFQNSEFNDGFYDGDADKFFLAFASLDYEINKFLTAGVSYNFDRLDSDVPNRSFTRNRVFFGLTAKY
jgi:hypothetical protein